MKDAPAGTDTANSMATSDPTGMSLADQLGLQRLANPDYSQDEYEAGEPSNRKSVAETIAAIRLAFGNGSWAGTDGSNSPTPNEH